MIHAGEARDVFDAIDALLNRLPGSAEHRELHQRAVAIARAKAEQGSVFLPIDVPFAVGDLLDVSLDEKVTAAIAGTLLWAGADLMDDVADGELGTTWDGVPEFQTELVATNLVSTLPHLAIAHVHCSDRRALLARELSMALWCMSDGQRQDIEGPNATPSLTDYFTLIERKTGAEIGLFAALPAILSGASPAIVKGWRAFGTRLGCMVQAFSDLASAVAPAAANDLLRGKRTLPVFCCAASLGPDDLDVFERDLCNAARGDVDALTRCMDLMVARNALRLGMLHVEVLRRQAVAALPLRPTDQAVDHPVCILLDQFRIVGRGCHGVRVGALR
jgi:hypothetical protein